jgi:hypothetical protein
MNPKPLKLVLERVVFGLLITFGITLLGGLVFPAAYGQWRTRTEATFPVEPYGLAQLGAEDNSEESRKLLQDLADNWTVLWPKMRDRLENGIADYGVKLNLSGCEFLATVAAVEEGCYKSEEADIFVRFEFETEPVPVWDFFIRGSHLAHFQPVF